MSANADRKKNASMKSKGFFKININNTTFRQQRVKGSRCRLSSTSNTRIWVTHKHTYTHRAFVYWETCTLNQHFFVIKEPQQGSNIKFWNSETPARDFAKWIFFIWLFFHTQTTQWNIKSSSIKMKNQCLTTNKWTLGIAGEVWQAHKNIPHTSWGNAYNCHADST